MISTSNGRALPRAPAPDGPRPDRAHRADAPCMSILPESPPRPAAPLAERFVDVRSATLALAEPLSAEDMQVQAEPCASPTKWHLAHTTWFFETVVLAALERDFRPHDHRFAALFNSYYHTLGDRHPRDRRGHLTRPGLDEVIAYRRSVDERVVALLRDQPDEHPDEHPDGHPDEHPDGHPDGHPDAHEGAIERLVELGLQHEQQHQELILTDIKLLLSKSPLAPVYRHAAPDPQRSEPRPGGRLEFAGGLVSIGSQGAGFAYDNELPAHRRFLEPFAIGDRLVTNAELQAFIDDGGYGTPTLWLDEGWTRAQRERWRGPLYWLDEDGPCELTLHGLAARDPHAPASHLSFFEAEAYARWAGARLPTEAEWEHAAAGSLASAGNLLDSGPMQLGRVHPGRARGEGLRQVFGDVWEWTRSAYEPYPGYRAPEGAYAEYNGKFMCGSFVLRGGSCATPRAHIRSTYRNFFEPGARWQFSGLRLAWDLT